MEAGLRRGECGDEERMERWREAGCECGAVECSE